MILLAITSSTQVPLTYESVQPFQSSNQKNLSFGLVHSPLMLYYVFFVIVESRMFGVYAVGIEYECK